MDFAPSAHLLCRLLLFACAVLLNSPTWGDDIMLPDLGLAAGALALSTHIDTGPSKRGFGAQLLHDTKYILSAPLRWDANDAMWCGIAAATVLGTGLLIDKNEGDGASDGEHPMDEFASHVEKFGGEYSFVTLAGFYAGGKLLRSPRAQAVAEDGLTASIIAAGIISPLVKWTVGRVRPANTTDTTDFRPFGHNHSFPSGHTTQAFTVASVISAHYDSPWIDAAAYTTAAFVGYARHQHQAHWASDIAAGAVLGIAVGHTVVRLNEENRGARVGVIPSKHGPMLGLVIPLD
jgi:hypothetical protein